MKCSWNSLLSVLPPRLRSDVDKLGSEKMEELRLRIGQPIELCMGQSCFLGTEATVQDLQFIINTASKYSPWAAATASKGYITAPGGHRIGLCGDCVIQNDRVCGVRTPKSLCIRVARDFPGIGKNAPGTGSLLILGPPGVGKTTLLRDLIRCRSQSGTEVAVVDERGELFPAGIFSPGPRTDILTGCSKIQGLQMALRTLGPNCIAVDEITATEDCQALINVGWCGVDILATAHAKNCADVWKRPVYQPLARSGLFTQAIVLERDKSWHMERMELCT